MVETASVSWPGWEVVRKLGEGSFGGVYEIQRTLPDGTVERAALKKLTVPKNPEEISELYARSYNSASITAHFREQMQDLVREYTLMQKLAENSNVVRCQDLRTVQHEDGIGWDIYIRMELLKPLKKSLDGLYDERRVILLGINLCSALNDCHQQNIIHRDIKPENILVTKDGRFKLGDFGIAKISERTATGTLTGTYSYMAPEIANRQHYGAAADIYSLGMVMYWMMNEYALPFLPLGKEIPSAPQRQEALNRRLSGEAIPAPINGTPELTRIVMKACAFMTEKRYQSTTDMYNDLLDLLRNDTNISNNPSEEYITRKSSRKTSVSNAYEALEDYGHDNYQSTSPDNTAYGLDRETGALKKGKGLECSPNQKAGRNQKKLFFGTFAIIVLFFASIVCGFAAAYFVSDKKTNEQYAVCMQTALASREDEPERALEFYKTAQNLRPEEADAYIGYARTLYLSRRFEATIDYIEDELEFGKRFPIDAQSELAEILASSYFETDEFANAASFFSLSAKGKTTTGYALCNYAVCLARLRDYDAANAVLKEMTANGAAGAEITYVQAEIDYAMEDMKGAERGLISVLSSTDNLVLQRRALRTLAYVYLNCAELDRGGFSTIENPAVKGITALEKGISEYRLHYDPSMLELLAQMYYEAYLSDEAVGAEYLKSSAGLFERIMKMGIKKDSCFQNLFNIYYSLKQYENAEQILQEYKMLYPQDYVPYAMRTILLMTEEGNKIPSERNYSAAFDEFATAEVLSEQADDLGYYYNTKYYIDELSEKGWQSFQMPSVGTDNPSAEEAREGVYHPEGNVYTTLMIGKIQHDTLRFYYTVNDEGFCSNTLAQLEDGVYYFSVSYGKDVQGNLRTMRGSIRFLNDGTVELKITEGLWKTQVGTTIFVFESELSEQSRRAFEPQE